MVDSDVEMLVVSHAKNKALKIIQLGKSLNFAAVVFKVNVDVFPPISVSLDAIVRALHRYDPNNMVDNIVFIKTNSDNIRNWENTAREYGEKYFCDELSELRLFLEAIISKNENPSLLMQIYDRFIESTQIDDTNQIERDVLQAAGHVAEKENESHSLDEIENVDKYKSIHNERTKITANAVNTTAVGLYGGGVLLPMIGISYPLPAAPALNEGTLAIASIWALAAIGLHWLARAMLGELK